MVSLRDGMIRISPHFYNNEQDVLCFFEALDDFSNMDNPNAQKYTC